MARIFGSVHEWLRECRAVIRDDFDDVVLVTGAEGVGKSTLAYQIGKALSNDFGLSYIGFSISDYIQLAKSLPQPKSKGKVVMSDEFLANKRKAMRRETVDLLDFLQECRGLNLHHLICFPHADLLDKAVLDHRVRWHVHIPKRGLFQVKEKIRFWQPGGIEATAWKVVGSWNYGPNTGPEWQAYKDAKHAHMMRPSGAQEEAESSWDLAFLAALPARYEKARGPRRSDAL